MKVFLNDYEMTIFNGARAVDAARKFLVKFELYHKLPTLVIRDHFHNEIAPDSPLHDGIHIYID